jgi:hypothetical protein
MTRALKYPLSLLLALESGACTSMWDPVYCTQNLVPGIVVEIQDKADGHPIATTASGTVTEGSFADSLWTYELLTPIEVIARASAWERKGTYRVHVQRVGYASWDTTGIRVTANECHVSTVRLKALLAPLP